MNTIFAFLSKFITIMKERVILGFGTGLLFLLFAVNATGQQKEGTAHRQWIGFNELWTFSKDPGGVAKPQDLSSLKWENVVIPHTWNARDVMDDEPGYYRGTGWYKRKFRTDLSLRDKDIFLSFNGANQETEVYVNGKPAGSHTGGYTRFIIPIKQLLKFDGDFLNEVVVKVNNRFNEDIAPLTADFTFFGGLYRNINLLITDQVHFSTTDKGSNGVYITTPVVSARSAQVKVKSKLENTSAVNRHLRLVSTVYDASGKIISTQNTPVKLAAGAKTDVVQELKTIVNPRLWSPEDPYRYKLITQLTDTKTQEVIDQVANPLGFRWFKFDADKGFFLNDKPLKIIGASRHQDYEVLGNAVPDALQVRDIELLKAMGGNFLRVAHYPQDPVILEACDRLGILASVEIPVVNAITETAAFTENCKNMQLEMIRQNFNHPSVIIWAYMNEVLLRPKFAGDKTRQDVYFNHIRELAQSLDELTRKEDPSRYTMIACHGDFDRYNSTGLTRIPMIVGWNLYQGWYSGTPAEFGKFLDKHHQELGDKPLLVTEYGADADPRIRSFTPVRFDKSAEYAVKFHQIYLNEMLKRPFVSGGMAWNLADFSSETREETMPHINNKGLLTLGRKPKDTYYLYQAYLLDKPFLKIASAAWKERSGTADSGTLVSTQLLQVATNLKATELFLNGRSLGIKNTIDHICEWEVPFSAGQNKLRVTGTDKVILSDEMDVSFKLLPFRFDGQQDTFDGLHVLLGAKRYFIDEQDKQLWIPDQPYRKGSWGAVGGEIFKGTNNRMLYGSDKNIRGTDNDPVYQTQLVNLKQYKMDVPDGDYELTLFFSELVGGADKETLAYNLDNTQVKEKDEQRVFDVKVNGALFLAQFNISAEYGYATAVQKKLKITVLDGKGITLDFISIKGKPVLNALQLIKTD
jgi:beta-galactosidase